MLVVYLWDGEPYMVNYKTFVRTVYIRTVLYGYCLQRGSGHQYIPHQLVYSLAHSSLSLYGDLFVDTYVPDLQSMHPPFLYFPATQFDEHACGWSAGLLRNFPPGHVCGVHTDMSVSVEYLPDPHG